MGLALAERLVTVFQAGGVQNPDLAILQSQLETYASNASNINTGVLGTSYGGTGRTDGMVTDVYCPTSQKTASQLGLLDRVDLKTMTETEFYSIHDSCNVWTSITNKTGTFPYGACIGTITKANQGNECRMLYDQSYVWQQHLNAQGQLIAQRPMFVYNNTDIHIYISKTGSDANHGFSADYPIQSLLMLLRLLASLKTNFNIFIHFGPGDWEDIAFTHYISSRFVTITNFDNTQDENFSHEYPTFSNIVFHGILGYLQCVKVKNLTLYNSKAVITSYTKFSHLSVLDTSSLYIIGNGLNIYETQDNPFANVFSVTNKSYLHLEKAITIDSDVTRTHFIDAANDVTVAVWGTITHTGNGITNKFRVQNACTFTGTISPENYPGTNFDNANGTVNYNGYRYVNAPLADNVYSLGNAAKRFTQVFAASATINTSDEREKENISAIPDEVLDAWEDVQFNLFQFKDAVEKKGVAARLHSALVAQRVMAVFAQHNLDAFRYGLLCYDKWDAKDWDEEVEVTPAKYKTVKIADEEAVGGYRYEEQLVSEAVYKTVHHHEDGGNRYGIRYEEALCMEAACQRRKVARLEARLAALEAKLK